MKKKWKIVLGLIVVFILAIAIYFTFFFHYTCSDLSCFYGHQTKCSDTKFLRQDSSADWLYHIIGKKGNECKIEVTISKVKLGEIRNLALEGKSMICLIPKNSFVQADSDLSRCTGPLKEELQSLIIEKLHSYIISNLGEIKGNLTRPI